MHNSPSYVLLLNLILSPLATTLTTLSSSTVPSLKTPRPSGFILSSGAGQTSSNWSSAIVSRSTESTPSKTLNAFASPYSKGLALMNVHLRNSSLPVNDSLLSNQSWSEDNPLLPLIDFSHGAIDRRGTYRFFVSIAIARWVQYAVHLWSPTILGDGVYARLPTVKGSTFVAFCTEYSARMSWAQTALRGRFNWVPTDYAPPIPENLQSTFERLREYLLSEQIFDGISDSKIYSVLKAIFADCVEVFENSGQPGQVYTNFTLVLSEYPGTVVTQTSSGNCPTMTLVFPKASPTPITTTGYAPAGDVRCRTYNPAADLQPSGTCDKFLAWGGCPADETWNNAYPMRLSGPLSNAKAIAGFFEAAEKVTTLITPTTTAPTPTGPTYGVYLGYQTRTIPVGVGQPFDFGGQSATLWFDQVIATTGFNIEPRINYCDEKLAKFGSGSATPRTNHPPYATAPVSNIFVGGNSCKWVPNQSNGPGSLSCAAAPTSVSCVPAYLFGFSCYDGYQDSSVQPLANCTWQKK